MVVQSVPQPTDLKLPQTTLELHRRLDPCTEDKHETQNAMRAEESLREVTHVFLPRQTLPSEGKIMKRVNADKVTISRESICCRFPPSGLA